MKAKKREFLYDVFLICPVRDITKEEEEDTKRYISNLERRRLKIYWPLRDTNQADDIGLKICKANFNAILNSREVHIWWSGNSRGSIFDFGMAFALLQIYDKKIILANPSHITKTEGKSFANVLLTIGGC